MRRAHPAARGASLFMIAALVMVLSCTPQQARDAGAHVGQAAERVVIAKELSQDAVEIGCGIGLRHARGQARADLMVRCELAHRALEQAHAVLRELDQTIGGPGAE